MSGIYPLKGVVKHYDWGGTRFIPHLIGEENKENRPFAEYWMGVHPMGSAVLHTAQGEKTLEEYSGQLGFLIKVLDVKDMLSIQVHPDRVAAAEGFVRENQAGIPLDAPGRNYRDDNHKPELMVALSDFWLLHGFKPVEEMAYTLLNVVELRELLPVFNESGYSGLYRHVMEMPQGEVDRILQPLIENISAIYTDGEPDRYDEDFWAARAAATFNKSGSYDRGIFSIYLFNLVHLKKGEGIFQGPGVPHAYLEGQNVEIMASSDNVLRGGLTSKHIDVNELLKHVKCEACYPDILSGEEMNREQLYYKTPAKDFRLEKIELEEHKVLQLRAGSSEILLLTEGELRLDKEGPVLKYGQPAAAVIAGTTYTITGLAPVSTLFRAFTGTGQLTSTDTGY